MALCYAASPAAAQEAQPAPAEDPVVQSDGRDQLEDITVTAQRREVGLQRTAVAVSAIGGETLASDRILSFEDIAKRITSLSFTAISGLDQEFNIRGITNTRLDSPSADQSIGVFSDDVYAGRPGLFNFDMYDIERVEVVRGPQGVLLGRNVVGGAISIVTARPSFDSSAATTFSYGNYNDVMARGYVTGGLTDSLAGRFSFQTRRNDGYSRDILHDRRLDDMRSYQGRGQLLFAPKDSDFEARLIVDYTHDESNGIAQIAIDGPNPGNGPWSAARAAIGVLRGKPLTIREALPQHPKFSGDAFETPQGMTRDALGINFQAKKDLGDVATLETVIGYRRGKAKSQYDQTGIGPANGYGVVFPTMFTTPVGEREKAAQFSQELRLVSKPAGTSGFDWIVGAYHQRDEVTKVDHLWGEVPLAALDLISGESRWDNRAVNESWAAFGQVGYRFSEQFRAVGGLRYSHDSKKGRVTATAIETGDRFNPGGTVPLTPLGAGLARGESFTAAYSDKWGQLTPQATLEFTPNDAMLFYATYSTGYKGGGFEDTPANAVAARISYDPETVTNYEVGGKVKFFDNRARVNVAAFRMDYNDLQVTQTDTNCLCSVTDNAANARIKGIEIEAQVIPLRGLQLFGSLTLLDTEYLEFRDSLGNDNEGKFLQRTPKSQFNVGFQYDTAIGSWQDALSVRVNYTRKGRSYWFPTNAQTEDPYGLLDARIALTPNEGRWTLALWGRNLTDTEYRVNVNYALSDEVSRFAAPRTYGAELSFKF
ncbi:TonB-dependent receptor [Sphingosinicella sp. LY1275]|uniref:TonB-dependent receptor n=1 Tax=Sphingosinicella sp. LY1275 TaxID=3095379 RepID=UPI002ADEE001|nr:TonB-dependent receptor [Sphingosinicella sp. LY1275]MEA1015350.1 TonB-dependent receptor [Sphingosinicella sp. LY1275]